ncbi:MAG: Rrf2 family transcriptional regulator [Alkalinema sp. FL-bin-369]|nr:Rrf2 family transcriptional regulator [Leptolyngbyaceae cyanobacterium LF-bin-369]
MELSCKSEYALLALLELALHHDQGEPIQIRQISAQQNIPDRYLEQLLAILRRAGIVRSQRGAKGGYFLVREPKKISLYEVVSCLEGFESQTQTPDQTTESTVVDELWTEARQSAHSVLQRYTLQDLCDRTRAKKQLDLMYYI